MVNNQGAQTHVLEICFKHNALFVTSVRSLLAHSSDVIAIDSWNPCISLPKEQCGYILDVFMYIVNTFIAVCLHL